MPTTLRRELADEARADQFDADGVPTHDKEGAEIPKSGVKKLRKEWEKQNKFAVEEDKRFLAVFKKADKNSDGRLDKSEISGGLGCMAVTIENTGTGTLTKTRKCTWVVVSPKKFGTKIGHPLLGEIRLRE